MDGLRKHWGKAIASSLALAIANFIYEAFSDANWSSALEVSFFQATAIFIFVCIWLREDEA